ncbi:magnesium/cobalt transporter CorA [Candidatus Blochmannia ocreatus (nom. nud.)]|uniref:Magnesium transport protein CorA n=1 Tax=Candidatus Blochmannia ocreatus (nom. nud.) TaxID=251538 RepID=A0ABY4SSU9_9ENTR|nr:magnesium/cobalt transporter CorA [Candidatus Blochmannia ocreatus]URJ25052.1 magnesium/cobalt transporter CorA [Candidatus Blochmannia ocreatus]
MFNIFQLKNNHLFRINEKENISFLKKITWVDIIDSSDAVHKIIKNITLQQKLKFFTPKNFNKTKRFLKDENILYMQSFFFSYNNQKKINNTTVSFTIFDRCLFTSRQEECPVFCIHQKYLNTHKLINENAYELLLSLFESKIEDLTNKIEHIYKILEQLSITIINKKKIDEYEHTLSDLSDLENIGWKIQINLLDSERAIKFIINNAQLLKTQQQYANNILDNIKSLLPHNKYIFHQINALNQSVMGFINIEQNKIIKIFSVIFLPPTLIASSYGMNFEFMPELQWTFGYPGAVILMILSSVAPYVYFKYKNWL